MFPARFLSKPSILWMVAIFVIGTFTVTPVIAQQNNIPTDPDAQSAPTSTTNTTPSTSAPVAKDPNPTKTNWDAGKQAVFTGESLVSMITCLGAGIPYNTNGCPITIFKNENKELIPVTKISYDGAGGGAIGASTRFIAQVYDAQPASGVQYLARNIMNGVPGVSPVYAQVGGTGSLVIQPVERIWRAFRDLAYLIYIIVFVVVGVMIMFRRKLNPQTVINLQNSLPGLVMGLILVTFSYLIAGFIIDIAFLSSQLVGVYFMTQVGGISFTDANGATRNLLDNRNFISMFTDFIFTGNILSSAGQIGTSLNQIIFPGAVGPWTRSLIGGLAACLNPIGLSAIGAGFATLNVPGAIGVITACGALGAGTAHFGGDYIISGIVLIILVIGLLQALIRLIFSLISTYVQIVVAVVFGPFYILFGSIPGNGKMITLWWKPLIANVLVFPAVFGAFLFIAAILGVGGDWRLNNVNTPGVGEFNQALPLFGGSPVGFIRAILAYGLLLSLPGLPDLVRDLLGAKQSQILQGEFGKNLTAGQQAGGLFGGTVGYGLYKGIGGGLSSYLATSGITNPGGFGHRFYERLKRGGFDTSGK